MERSKPSSRARPAGTTSSSLERKVLFFHAVFLGEQREAWSLHGFFFRELLEFGFLGVFLIFRLRGRAATCEHVEIFALDNLGGLLRIWSLAR